MTDQVAWQSIVKRPHRCFGAECPVCGVFAPPEVPQEPPQEHVLARFSDSCGLPVAAWPQELRIGVTGILFRHRKGHLASFDMLVHKRADNGWWGFPGGRMEIGETIFECLAREMQEETGFIVTPFELVCIDSDPKEHAICQYPDGNIVQYCAITFLCTASESFYEHPKISSESQELRWIPVTNNTTLPRPFLPAHLWRFEQADLWRRITQAKTRMDVVVK